MSNSNITTTTTPTYAVTESGFISQTNAETETRYFNFGWVKVWATSPEVAEAIVRAFLAERD